MIKIIKNILMNSKKGARLVPLMGFLVLYFASPLLAVKPGKREAEFLYQCETGNTDRCLELLEDVTDINYKTPTFNETFAHYASWYGNRIILEKLIEKGANLNCLSAVKYTPLHYACQWGHLSIVELLINKVETINTKNKANNTPLHKAICSKNLQIVEMLEKSCEY
jgi:ankyrin repeat protein